MPDPPIPPRFIADVMLGKLARWLRILGYDVLYSNVFADQEIVARALEDDRVILTRDVRMLERRKARKHVFIESGDLDAQMEQVIGTLHLERLELFSRCLECNRPLDPETREAIEDRVPPYVFQTQKSFKSCPDCSRVYWPGTHRDHVRQRVDYWFHSK